MILHVINKRKDNKYLVALNYNTKQLKKIMTKEQLIKAIESCENQIKYREFIKNN